MRTCVLAIVWLAALSVASCKKKSSEPAPGPAPAPDARVADALPKVDAAESLAPASVVLPTAVARIAADGTVTGAPPPPAPKPPEPPAAAKEDDGADESGGRGSLVNLDEGQLAREKAIELARNPHDPRNAELLKKYDLKVMPKGERYGSSSHPMRPSSGVPAEIPQRQGKAIGETLDEPLPESMPQLLVAAHPAAKATALVDVVAVHPALIAVAHQGATRALRVGFVAREHQLWNGNWTPWVEVRVTGDGVVVEGVPGTPVVLNGALDGKALGEAWKAQREPDTLPDRVDVDVLVDDSVDVQRLVDVLAALDAGGARVFALGRLPPPDSDEMKKRGKKLGFVQLERISMVGGLDKAVVEAALVAPQAALRDCWKPAPNTKPAPFAVVYVQFFITPTGKVGQSNARGGDAAMSACVAKVVRGIAFPKPSGGGGAQVNAPFMLRM